MKGRENLGAHDAVGDAKELSDGNFSRNCGFRGRK